MEKPTTFEAFSSMMPTINQLSTVQPSGIPSLTGVRGLASLWVMLFHIQLNAGRFFGLPALEALPFLNSGWHAVDLFFMLSGFILMYAHDREFVTLRKASIIRFAKLRFARIYPMNTAVLLLIGALSLANRPFVSWMRVTNDPADFSQGAFFQTLLLANRWFLFRKGSWNEPVWSLSFEIIGYALFPALAYWISGLTTRCQATTLVLASLASFMYFSLVEHLALTNIIGQIAIARMLSCFVVGIAICRLWMLTDNDGERWASVLTMVGVLGIAIACLRPAGNLAFNSLFAVLLFALAFQKGVISSLLSSQPLMFLGRISFPLYLIHGVVLWELRYFIRGRLAAWSHWQTSALLMGGSLGCIVLSTLFHLAVERPAHSFGRRWAGMGVVNSRRLKRIEVDAVFSKSGT